MINNDIELINMIKIFDEDQHIIDMYEINDNMHVYAIGGSARGNDQVFDEPQSITKENMFEGIFTFKRISYRERI